MKLVSLQIGNSDNKLTQQEWSDFIDEIHYTVGVLSEQVHFSGGSNFDEPWQNACWVFEVEDMYLENLISRIKQVREQFKQDSACVLIGEPQFV